MPGPKLTSVGARYQEYITPARGDHPDPSDPAIAHSRLTPTLPDQPADHQHRSRSIPTLAGNRYPIIASAFNTKSHACPTA